MSTCLGFTKQEVKIYWFKVPAWHDPVGAYNLLGKTHYIHESGWVLDESDPQGREILGQLKESIAYIGKNYRVDPKS